jgi:putative DNA primase/helicase
VDDTTNTYAGERPDDSNIGNRAPLHWTGWMSGADHVRQARWRTRDCHPYRIPGLRSLLDPSEIYEEKRRAPKDGFCFVPGVLKPLPSGELALRQRDRVTEISMLVADLDMGTPFASLRARLEAARVFALVVPTYSHGRRSWSFRVPPARWQAYLAEFGSAEAAALAHGATLFLPAIVDGGLDGPAEVRPVNPAKPDGILIVSFTWAQPVPRWRVAVPLAPGWKVEGEPSLETAEAWSRLYGELTEGLGFWDCDPSCSDASRLFYSARWPAAWPTTELDPAWAQITAELATGEPGPEQALAEIDGPIASIESLLARRETLKWPARISKKEDRLRRDFEAASQAARERLPQISGQRGRRRPGQPRALAPWLVRHPVTGEAIDLTAWHQRYGWELKLASLIEAEHADLIAARGEGGDGKLHILCPTPDLHGTERDDGTFVWDGDGVAARGEAGARRGGMFCNHHGCSGRSAGENLALLLDAGVLSWERLEAVAATVDAERVAALTTGNQADEDEQSVTEVETEARRTSADAPSEAKPISTPKVKPRLPPPVLDPGAPLPAARILLERHFQRGGQRTLHRLQGVFYRWSGAHYRALSEEEVKARIYRFLEGVLRPGKDGVPRAFDPNRGKVADVLEALAAAAHLPAQTAAPAWLGSAQPELPAKEILACQNGLLHWPTRQLLPHTPAFFNVGSVPYAYQSDVPPPVEWLRFLKLLWPEDQESIDALQELFGLLLTVDTSYQKLFMLVGPPRSGRGTIARVLVALLGRERTAGPTLASLGETFGLEGLLDKSLAVVADARLSRRTDIATLVERLLALSGEDQLSVPRKHQKAWVGTLSARFMILTNELPRMPDVSGALASRFIVWRLTESFLGREDRGLLGKLLPELPRILNWALAGLDRLARRGRFQQPGSAVQLAEELAGLTSPMRIFIRECCVVKPKQRVSCAVLYRAWTDWCRSSGRKNVGTTQDLGRGLRAVAPGVQTKQMRARGTKQRFDGYIGIGLRVTAVPVNSGAAMMEDVEV